ncbi:hypothetical protein [Limnoglobus roseus]|uniref:Uncharacterized protein n=1 Tax=Limnoglobus roseus TaxID=2598579 RepID=A0A5C1AQP2_9BACT|nr:hypothetical protein [Limnoglobus roseus]QEL20052.1 hypothetical protein PX52LOC_07138 [Limnoglobus roseus]
MNQSLLWLRRGCVMAILLLAGAGCDPASLSYFLFRGDQRAPAEAKAFEPKKDKREVVVAVLVNSPVGSLEFAGLDRDITSAMVRMFDEQTKDKKPHVTVVNQTKLDRYKASHPSWRSMNAADIGKELGAEYTLEMTITAFNLYEPGTGRNMYMGQSSATVVVHETATGDEFAQYFVDAPLESKPADSMPAGQYKTELVKKLALRTSWKHIPHVTDQRISGVQ